MADQSKIYEFGDSGRFRLDPVGRKFERDGRVVDLKGMPFELLHYLLQHPQVAIPKDDLKRALWGRVNVTDETLKPHFTKLYDVLQDKTRPRTIIFRDDNHTKFLLQPRQIPRPKLQADPAIIQEQQTPTPDRPVGLSEFDPATPWLRRWATWRIRFFSARKATLFIAVAGIGVASSVYGLKPHIAAPATEAPKNVERPFGATFKFQNDNLFAMRDVQFRCRYPYMLFNSEAGEKSLDMPVVGRPERIEAGQDHKFVCPWAVVTKVYKYLSAPVWKDLNATPITKSGVLTLTMNKQPYVIPLSGPANNLHGLIAALEKVNVVVKSYAFDTTLSDQRRTMYGFYLLVPADQLSLKDGDIELVDPRPADEDQRLKEIQTAVTISYRYLLWPRALSETFYYVTRITPRDGIYFGSISKSDLGRN